MTPEKLRLLIHEYRSIFVALGIEPEEYPHDDLVGPKSSEGEADVLAHCCAMLPKMEVFVSEGRIEEAMRWLVFVQGCLFSCGIFSFEDLENHRHPDEEPA
ncbi:MAG TPA: hypothetical protein VGE23_00765 [Candidatus Paceibacterota bacterium]